MTPRAWTIPLIVSLLLVPASSASGGEDAAAADARLARNRDPYAPRASDCLVGIVGASESDVACYRLRAPVEVGGQTLATSPAVLARVPPLLVEASENPDILLPRVRPERIPETLDPHRAASVGSATPAHVDAPSAEDARTPAGARVSEPRASSPKSLLMRGALADDAPAASARAKESPRVTYDADRRHATVDASKTPETEANVEGGPIHLDATARSAAHASEPEEAPLRRDALRSSSVLVPGETGQARAVEPSDTAGEPEIVALPEGEEASGTSARDASIDPGTREAPTSSGRGATVTFVALTLSAVAALLGLAVALYSRLGRRDVQEQVTREAILGALAQEGGRTASDLSKALQIHRTTVQYHLRVLARGGAVNARRVGRRDYYELAGAAPEDGTRAKVAQRSETARAILAAATERPGIGVAEAARAAGVHAMTVRYHARQLAEAGVLAIEKRGGSVGLFPAKPAA